MHWIARTLLERVGWSVSILILVSLIIFLSVSALPGDAAEALLGNSATPETVAALRHQFGLDKTIPVRYWDWLSEALQGDFGQSLATGRSVGQVVRDRFGNTVFLALFAAIMSVPLSIGLGIVTARFRNTYFDRVSNMVALTALSLPEFFVAYLLIYVLAIGVEWFPSMASVSGDLSLWNRLYVTFLPALSLTFVTSGYMMRLTRVSVVNVLASPYIEMAILKGMSPRRVIGTHALRNALSPIINVTVVMLAYLFVGVVVVEVVFVYPGLGQLLVDSVAKRDLPVVQACSLIFAVIFVALNLLADILSMLANPRLTHGR